MLFTARALDGIHSGTITLAFRRWNRPSVKRGTALRTAIGVIEITAIGEVTPAAISAADARKAGFASPDDVLASLGRRTGTLYRIALRRAGDDPRVALRKTAPSAADAADIVERLARMDAARRAPWTKATLAAIAAHPAMRAADLAARFGRDTKSFKIDVRKLKELGLTESLEVGYRLSPRGRSVLRRLSRTA